VSRPRLALWLSGATVVAVVIALLVTWSPPQKTSPAALTSATTDPTTHFLDAYVQADGRVSRLDQGGDTVSEGQAYGLLLAVANDDETRFDRIWQWTQTHLQRPDSLLSWTWAKGAVTDPSSASDADLDTAHALLAAADHFDRPQLRAEGLRIGTAILEHESARTPRGLILTAGSWADAAPWAVNPSYGSPLAISYLSRVSKDPRWAELATGDRAVLSSLLKKAALPPDWAQVTANGEVAAMPAPKNAAGAGEVQFGLDAARVSVRAAASCSSADRSVAADLDRTLQRPADQVRGAYDLGGGAVVSWTHPLQLVATAAAAGANDDAATGTALMSAAVRLSQQQPTYYGTAWTALGEVLLQQRSVLRPPGCEANPPIGTTGSSATGSSTTGSSATGPDAVAATGGASVPARQVRATAVDPGLVPVDLEIPAIGVSSSLVKLGIAKNGTIEVPANAQRAGWLTAGPAPGERGPAVIAGHLDTRTGPAIFARLDKLHAGDTVRVRQTNGQTVTFTVDGSERVAKNKFPTAEVYGPVPGPVLRLITCGGTIDPATGHYRDNVIVYASVH
jgi:LPXTG-site transpeptidase (sortase) family protein